MIISALRALLKSIIISALRALLKPIIISALRALIVPKRIPMDTDSTQSRRDGMIAKKNKQTLYTQYG
jgi:hypothetical protein